MDFEIPGKIKECHIGPSVTQYELELQAGTKVNKLLSENQEKDDYILDMRKGYSAFIHDC